MWNYLTFFYLCLWIIYLINMIKPDLELNNLQWFICHQTKPNHDFPKMFILNSKEFVAVNF